MRHGRGAEPTRHTHQHHEQEEQKKQSKCFTMHNISPAQFVGATYADTLGCVRHCILGTDVQTVANHDEEDDTCVFGKL